jgi:uncharacterized membrane protein
MVTFLIVIGCLYLCVAGSILFFAAVVDNGGIDFGIVLLIAIFWWVALIVVCIGHYEQEKERESRKFDL